jgi:hypothetical protein
MEHVIVAAQCYACKCIQAVDVPEKSWKEYSTDRNALVQNIFPDLDADDREILIGADSGVYHCPPCWEKMIPWDEE